MYVMKKMPSVTACTIGDCAYNIGNACHALAITIGEGKHPLCDTFFNSLMRGGANETAGVGACKVTACRHNREFECSAPDIRVGGANYHGSCLTFAGL